MRRVFALLLIFTGSVGRAETVPGYLWDTEGERDVVVQDLDLAPPPAPIGGTLTGEKIVNHRLAKEFDAEYRNRFGFTETAQAFEPTARVFRNNTLDVGLQDPEISQNKQREFGEYMFRRLAEHHVDDYIKSDPDLRPVYVMKERLSNVSVEVASGYRLDSQYHFSGNFVTLNMHNPFIDTLVRLQMNAASFGPGPVEETVVSLGRSVTRTVRVDSHYFLSDDTLTLVGSKKLNEWASTSLTGTKDNARRGLKPPEDIIMAGLHILY